MWPSPDSRGLLSKLAPGGRPWLPIRSCKGASPVAAAASETVTRDPAPVVIRAPSAGVGDCQETTGAWAPVHGRAEAVPAARANTNRVMSAPAACA